MVATSKGVNDSNGRILEMSMRQKKTGRDKEQEKMKISFIKIRISEVPETNSTHTSFNNVQKYLNAIMTTLLHTKNTIRFLYYYGDSMTPEIIKINDNLTTIHRHKKLFQGTDMRSKGWT